MSGLLRVEPPKSQPTLVELRSSQIGAPTCFLVRIIDQVRYVACVYGMAGNHADRWGLSHLEPPKSQPMQNNADRWGARRTSQILTYTGRMKTFPFLCANMFLSMGYIDEIRCCICARDAKETGT